MERSGVAEYFNIKHCCDGHLECKPALPTEKRRLEQTTVYMQQKKITVLALSESASVTASLH
jgi:hypothetical protein